MAPAPPSAHLVGSTRSAPSNGGGTAVADEPPACVRAARRGPDQCNGCSSTAPYPHSHVSGTVGRAAPSASHSRSPNVRQPLGRHSCPGPLLVSPRPRRCVRNWHLSASFCLTNLSESILQPCQEPGSRLVSPPCSGSPSEAGVPKQPVGPLNQLDRKSTAWTPPWPSAAHHGVPHSVGTKPKVQLWLQGLTSAQPVRLERWRLLPPMMGCAVCLVV